MNLYAHQQKLVDQNPARWLMAWGCGSGKTLTAISLANKNNVSVLVIVPKSLRENWTRQLDMHYTGPEYCVMTKEEFRRDWEGVGWYQAVICDEAHFFSGMTSLMSKNLGKYLKKKDVPYRWFLTATPFLSSPWNIYVLAHHLGLKLNYYSFKTEFFTDVRMGGRIVPIAKKGPKVELALRGYLLRIGNTVALEDCVDMPDQIYETEYFTLTKEQQSAIDQIQDVEHIVRYTKHHQITGGFLKSDGYTEDEIFPCEKLVRLKELALEHDRMIVVARYRGEIAMIAQALDCGKQVYTLTGDTTDRQELIDTLQKTDKYVLVVSAGVSEGWELPECGVMIFYSYDYSLKNFIQIIGRVQRINNVKKNLYLSLVVEDTIDEDVYECIRRKEDFHLSLYNR